MDLKTLADSFGILTDSPGAVEKLRLLILQIHFSHVDQVSEGFVTVESVIDSVTSGFACNRSHQVDHGYVHLRTHNIDTEGKLNFDLLVKINPSLVDPSRASLEVGDVIFNNTNSRELVGKTALVAEKFKYAFSNHLTRIRLNQAVSPSYFVKYFNYLWRTGYFAALCNKWIGQAGINTKMLKQIPFFAPDLEAQHRIVAKVDHLMALCDELEQKKEKVSKSRIKLNAVSLDRLISSQNPEEFEENWGRVKDNFEAIIRTPEDLSVLNSTILRLAITGKLSKGQSDEGPFDFSEDGLGDRVSHSTAGESINLPENWRSIALGNLGSLLSGATPSKRKPEYWEGKIPWISPKDMKRLNIDSGVDFVSEKALTESRLKLIPVGSILMVVRGMILIHSFPVAATTAELTINQDIKALVLRTSTLFPWVMLSLRAYKGEFVKMVRRSSHGTCRLETDDILNFCLHIPPLPEQARIIKNVDDLFALTNRCALQLDRLSQSATKTGIALRNSFAMVDRDHVANELGESGLPKHPTVFMEAVV